MLNCCKTCVEELGAERGKNTFFRDVKFLEKVAHERWELVLYSLAGIAAIKQYKPSADTLQILSTAGLIKKSVRSKARYFVPFLDIHFGIIFQWFLKRRNNSRRIPFSFDGHAKPSLAFYPGLFDNRSEAGHGSRRMSFVYFSAQFLSSWKSQFFFLFVLDVFMTFLLFQQYSSSSLSPNQLKMLLHFRDYGLVVIRKQAKSAFYPTNLVVNLSSGANRRIGALSDGFIVVETNYRLYAYTDSPLKIAVVSYFCEMLYR